MAEHLFSDDFSVQADPHRRCQSARRLTRVAR